MTRKKGFSWGIWCFSGVVALLLASAVSSLAQTKDASSKTLTPIGNPPNSTPQCKAKQDAQAGHPLKVLRSAVQRELDALFAKRGYRAPRMTVQEAVKGLPKPEDLGAVIGELQPAEEKPKRVGLQLVAPLKKLGERLRPSRSQEPIVKAAEPAASSRPQPEFNPFPDIKLTKGQQQVDQQQVETKEARVETKEARKEKTRLGKKTLAELIAKSKKDQSKERPVEANAKPVAKPLPLPVPERTNAVAAHPRTVASQSKGLASPAKTAKPAKANKHVARSDTQEPTAKQPPEKTHAKVADVALRPLTKKEIESMYQKIRERRDRSGFKGFCPVALRDRRQLVDANEQLVSIFHGKKYYFSSMEAKARFDANPERYAPAADGCDVVLLKQTSEKREGSLDHAVWFRGRLYLFCSKLTEERFVANPTQYAVE